MDNLVESIIAPVHSNTVSSDQILCKWSRLIRQLEEKLRLRSPPARAIVTPMHTSCVTWAEHVRRLTEELRRYVLRGSEKPRNWRRIRAWSLEMSNTASH